MWMDIVEGWALGAQRCCAPTREIQLVVHALGISWLTSLYGRLKPIPQGLKP
jgi:hypothetical protein